jgi:hypothetical protein
MHLPGLLQNPAQDWVAAEHSPLQNSLIYMQAGLLAQVEF